MATLQEARLRWQEVQSKFKQATPFRIAYMGDGRGTSRSNMYSSHTDTIVYARDSLTDTRFFTVLNKRVNPVFNLPVILGYTDEDPKTEQVLGIHWATLELITTPGTLGGVDPHHVQHQFGGGDEVFIDSRLFLPGLVRPTDPPSMTVTVVGFAYYYNGWQFYAGETTESLQFYKPTIAGDGRYITVCLDPAINSIVFRIGDIFGASRTWEDLLSDVDGDQHIPDPSGDEVPLGAIYLTSSTTTIDWDANGVNNLFDARFHITPSYQRIEERLAQLEGITGNEPSLATAGAGTLIAGDEPMSLTIDGSRGGNVALNNLIKALARKGIIIDNTVA